MIPPPPPPSPFGTFPKIHPFWCPLSFWTARYAYTSNTPRERVSYSAFFVSTILFWLKVPDLIPSNQGPAARTTAKTKVENGDTTQFVYMNVMDHQ